MLSYPLFGHLLDRVIDGSLPFTFHFQPIVDLRRGVTVGYEALARFPAEMGPTPDVCFRAAADLGRQFDLEEVVSARALESRSKLPSNCFLSVNVSPGFLLSDQWAGVLARAGRLDHIVVEITEESSITSYDPIREKIAVIRNLGGHVAVDDTGSGYASLRHVMELKPQFVKLDRFFIGGCNLDRGKSALIEMIGKTADRLDAWIVAEGIETANELDEVLRLGVPLGQGYFLGRPVPNMGEIAPGKAIHCARRFRDIASTDNVLSHLETCMECGDLGEALKAIAGSVVFELAVVLDQWLRPDALVEHHPLLGVRPILSWMSVQTSSDAVEVLQRALTRDAALRFDPLMVVDEFGKFAGVLRIDRLMRTVLDTHVAIAHAG